MLAMKNIHTYLTTILMATVLAACTVPVGPDDDPDPNPEPEPEPEVVQFDIKLKFTKLEAKEDCDPDVLFGADNAGEFSYKVGYRARYSHGGESSITYVHETEDFRSEDGDRVKIKTGESHSLGGTATLTLSEGEGYAVYLNAAEWDPTNVDPRMDYDDEAWANFTVGGQSGTVSFEVTDGDDADCKVTLHGTTRETRK